MRTNDGLTLRGCTPEEMVEELRASSRSPGLTLGNFMDEMASRTLLLTGHRVRTRTAQGFIEDLVAAGVLLVDDEVDNPSQEE